MKFNLIDKVERIDDARVVAVKCVSLAEEYLADHFPAFPVLPGVLMLEALVQAAGWLLHRKNSFCCAFATLKEARNVRYGHFVAPGNSLRVEADLKSAGPGGAKFEARGFVDGAQAVAAKLELAYFNLASHDAGLAPVDERVRAHNRRRWRLIAPAQDNDAEANEPKSKT